MDNDRIEYVRTFLESHLDGVSRDYVRLVVEGMMPAVVEDLESTRDGSPEFNDDDIRLAAGRALVEVLARNDAYDEPEDLD